MVFVETGKQKAEAAVEAVAKTRAVVNFIVNRSSDCEIRRINDDLISLLPLSS